MNILDWYRRYAEHIQAADTSGWAPGVSEREDFDWEWPNITGDDSDFWDQLEGERPEPVAVGAEGKALGVSWREILHPRDRSGRFAPKPSRPSTRSPRRRPQPRPSFTPDPAFIVAANRVNALQSAELADGRDTRNLFDRLNGVDGKYRAERERRHEEIIAEFLDRPASVVQPGQTPVLVMVGGIPGAGKTYTINSPDGQGALGIALDDFVMMNPDDVKDAMIRRGMIPDYDGLTPNEAGTLVHLESVDIVAQISRRAMAQGRNVMWDSSMRDRSQAEEFIRYAVERDAPYDIWTIIVESPMENALRQAVNRYMKGGRFMPLDHITRLKDPEWGTQPRATFEKLKAHPNVRRWFRFENDGKSAPRIIESSEDDR